MRTGKLSAYRKTRSNLLVQVSEQNAALAYLRSGRSATREGEASPSWRATKHSWITSPSIRCSRRGPVATHALLQGRSSMWGWG